MNRQAHKANSNNSRNPNQNVCAQRVAQALGVADQVRYLHTIEDMKRAVQKRYSMRSVATAVKSKTVGGARKNMPKVKGALYFVVHVPGHVLLLDHNGKTIVDTAPRKRDRRQMYGVYGVYRKKGC